MCNIAHSSTPVDCMQEEGHIHQCLGTKWFLDAHRIACKIRKMYRIFQHFRIGETAYKFTAVTTKYRPKKAELCKIAYLCAKLNYQNFI